MLINNEMTRKQVLGRKRCQSCKKNDFVCSSNPLHIMFKYIQYTEEGREAFLYYGNKIYNWFYDGLESTNNSLINYDRKSGQYEGLVYQLGVELRKKS